MTMDARGWSVTVTTRATAYPSRLNYSVNMRAQAKNMPGDRKSTLHMHVERCMRGKKKGQLKKRRRSGVRGQEGSSRIISYLSSHCMRQHNHPRCAISVMDIHLYLCKCRCPYVMCAMYACVLFKIFTFPVSLHSRYYGG